MNTTTARLIVDLVQGHVDTFPGETAEAKASTYYIEAVDCLNTLYVTGTCCFYAALGRQGVRPKNEEC